MQAPADPVPDGQRDPVPGWQRDPVPDGRRDPVPDRQQEAGRAMADLYRTHWDSLVRLAWLIIRDQAVAEEIVADALVAVHGRWDRLDATQNIPAYLRRSVINGCRSVGRRRVLERAQLAREVAAAHRAQNAPSAEAEVIDRIRRDSLLRALSSLPRRQREVLVLRYYLDLSERQIADTLQIATGSVKAHAHRGLAALRAKIPTDTSPEL